MLVDELIDLALAKGGDERVLDVRAGLGYTCVRLQRGCGLAYTFRHELGGCCSVLGEAGSLINHTLEDILPHCQSAREVCLVGASTPLSPEVFEKYNVTLLAGSVVTDPDLALQIVSQGGGTGALKPAMDHVLQRI